MHLLADLNSWIPAILAYRRQGENSDANFSRSENVAVCARTRWRETFSLRCERMFGRRGMLVVCPPPLSLVPSQYPFVSYFSYFRFWKVKVKKSERWLTRRRALIPYRWRKKPPDVFFVCPSAYKGRTCPWLSFIRNLSWRASAPNHRRLSWYSLCKDDANGSLRSIFLNKFRTGK